MNKNETIKEMTSEITEVNRRLEALEKWIEKQKEELKTAEENIEAAKKDKEFLEMAIESLTEYKGLPEVKEEKKKEEVKIPEKELTYSTKKPKVGRFDMHGNQTGLWYTQAMCAKEIGMSAQNVGHIMKTSKESQLKRRGYYLMWVH